MLSCPGGLTIVRFSLGACAALVFASAALAQKSFVRPHLWKDPSGVTQAVAWDVSGGQEEVSATGVLTRSPVDALFSLYGNDGFYKWLSSWINGVPADLTLDAHSLEPDERLAWTLSDMVPLMVVLPRCDVNSSEAGGLRAVGRITFKAKEGASLTRAADDARRQKKWLCSNFRLRMGDLPCSRTITVDSITMRRASGDLDGDGAPDLYFAPDQFSFEVPAADAPSFQKAFEATVAGTPTPYPIVVDYLDADGNVLMTFGMTGAIWGSGPTDLWLDPLSPRASHKVTVRSVHDAKKSVLNIIR